MSVELLEETKPEKCPNIRLPRKMVGDNVFVKMDMGPERRGSILMPDNHQVPRGTRGQLLSSGESAFCGEVFKQHPDIQDGDTVMFAEHGGDIYHDYFSADQGCDPEDYGYRIFKDQDICAVIRKMQVKAIGYFVLIVPEKVNPRFNSMIYKPASAIQREQHGTIFGTVASIGESVFNATVFANKPDLKIGDKVLYARYAGMEVHDPDTNELLYRVVPDIDIAGIL